MHLRQSDGFRDLRLTPCASQDNTVGLSKFAGPGGFNDPDMLEVRILFHSPCLHVCLHAAESRDAAQSVNVIALCAAQVGNPGLTEQVGFWQ